MHKVSDSFLVKLPIDTQSGSHRRSATHHYTTFLRFCQQAKCTKNKRKTAIFSTGLRNFGETAQKFGTRFVYFSQIFCRIAQIRSGKFGTFAQKKKSPLIRGLNCCGVYGIIRRLWYHFPLRKNLPFQRFPRLLRKLRNRTSSLQRSFLPFRCQQAA